MMSVPVLVCRCRQTALPAFWTSCSHCLLAGAGVREKEVSLSGTHRARVAAAAFVLLQGNQGSGGWHKRSPEFCWATHVDRMTEAEFKLRYRVGSDAFYELLDLIRPELETNAVMAAVSRSGKPIPIQAVLACALRFFAGGDPHDLKLIYCMSKTQVMRCVWRVVDAINLRLDNMKFPIDDLGAMNELERDFAAATRGGFWRGQAGAIDGVHFRMKCPPASAVKDPMRYYVARKQEFALLAIAICDYKRRFTWAEISHASCTHDSTAWAATKLGQRVEKGDLPKGFFLNGDAAFALSPWMIVPSTGDASLDDFDFYQSSNRMAIECAFGILVRRWGVLWRPLSMEFSRRAPLILALMRLHNFCIDQRLLASGDLPNVDGKTSEVQPGRYKIPPKFDKDGRPVEMLDTCRWNDEGAPVRTQASLNGPKAGMRDALAAAIKEAGFVRQVRNHSSIVRRKRGR